MARTGLPELNAFAAIATHRSFRKAADALGMSPSALSHTVRTLEERLGVRLFNRTSRSVSITETGERLLNRLRPALRDLDEALSEVSDARAQPGGTVRINLGREALPPLLRFVVPELRRRFPEVRLDLVVEGRLVDIVAEGFDAGVRLGESVPQDMIAVRFGGDARLVPVASPRYLEGRRAPRTPEDLAEHDCIRYRMPSGKPYRWEFEHNGQPLEVDVQGTLTLNDQTLMAEAAADGLGVAFVFEWTARPFLESGRLVPLLEPWCPRFPGLFLYYPGRRHVPAGLRALIDVLKETAHTF
jgi:DNA-binding transcriptional LysR family regulator